MERNVIRPFLKWAGNKVNLADKLTSLLPAGKTLIEPFVGSGAVFLNTKYQKYILCDINADLISLYQTIQECGAQFIVDAKKYFSDRNNSPTAFYRLRTEFNKTRDSYTKACLFLYLNRHCYNGLCRYNQSGEFNVPFGKYKRPYFPELELHQFYVSSRCATFYCEPFKNAFARAKKDSVIYCDPPYIPLSLTSNFTSFASGGFSLDDQRELARLATIYRKRNIPTLISNHDVAIAREIFSEAKFHKIQVRRRISADASKRTDAAEILALYG